MQQDKSFYMYLEANSKVHEYMYRIYSSQHLPQTMRAWERMRNFIILKDYVGLRVELPNFLALVNIRAFSRWFFLVLHFFADQVFLFSTNNYHRIQ